MEARPVAIGIELVVTDLDRAVELFVEVLGCELLGRAPAAHVEGEMATVDAGNVVISLLQPAGPGHWLKPSQRRPRLSQIVFATDGSSVDAVAAETVARGLPVIRSEGRFHITPEAVEGALGAMTAIVVLDVEQTAAADEGASAGS